MYKASIKKIHHSIRKLAYDHGSTLLELTGAKLYYFRGQGYYVSGYSSDLSDIKPFVDFNYNGDNFTR
jgi:hypothetical protein